MRGDATQPTADAPVVAVVSMLHEVAGGSATRDCGGRSVLARTLSRLAGVTGVDAAVVLCRRDQAERARDAAGDLPRVVPVEGQPHASLRLVTASQMFADGWRGGVMGTCPADRGYDAVACRQINDATGAVFLYVLDASFALLDVDLSSRLIAHARANVGKAEPVMFTPCPPGLTGLVVSRGGVALLAAERDPRRRHPGRLTHYLPDLPRIDPVGTAACLPCDPALMHATYDARIDTDTRAAAYAGDAASLPPRRDVQIDLTTRRRTRPVWLRHVPAADVEVQTLAKVDVADARITLGGVGDPLLHDRFIDAVRLLRDNGAAAIHVETDGVGPDDARTLAEAGVDVVSIHLPATTTATYAAVMGTNSLATATATVAALLGVTTVVVPTFVKLRPNVAEMEAWYDQWQRLASAAVIRGPDAWNLAPADDAATLAAGRLLRTDRRFQGQYISPMSPTASAA